jgi:uncharacterized protein YdbL (DUF1318 family)
MQTDEKVRVLSSDPDDFVVGGLLSDVDVEVLEAQYTLDAPEHYKADKAPLFVRFKMKDLTTGGQAEQYWSSGSAADFIPSQDGNFVLANPDNPAVTALRKSSNWYAMLNSLRTNGGMPKGYLNGPSGLAALKGLKFHAIQAPAPERAGLERKESKYAPTILICSKVLPGAAPWDKKGTKTGTPGRAVASPVTAPVGVTQPAAADNGTAGDADSVIAAALKAVIEATTEKSIVGLNEAAKDTYKHLAQVVKASNDVRNAAAKKVRDSAWLEANGFLVMDQTIVLAD